jgi:ankyrin repeat protein
MGKKKSKARSASGAVVVSAADIEKACLAGDLTKLRRWGRQGVRVTSAEPLFFAIEDGKLDLMRCLVDDLSADVNQANVKGATPLYIAAYFGRLDIVRCLVGELGASIHQATHDGSTVLQIAAHGGHLNVVRCLVEDFGADVSQADQEGVTALIMAAHSGNYDMVRYLVMELRADINQAANDGQTPLMLAAHGNNQPLLKHLVHKGAHVRTVSTAGQTAVTMLATAGATAAQIAYLDVRERRANPGCEGGGRKRCCVCKATRYCGMACRVAHWRVHRVGCRPPIEQESKGSEVAS